MLGAMRDASFSGLGARIDTVSNGAALHEDDGMVAVLASDRRGQSENKSRLRAPRHQLKARRREMMAFVNDEMTVIRDKV